MDRNSIIGMVLIMGLLFGYMYYNQPSKEELAKKRRYNDSIERVHQEAAQKQMAIAAAAKSDTSLNKTALADSSSMAMNDSVRNAMNRSRYGALSAAVQGENKSLTIENELIKATLSTKGGRITSVELKKYKTHDQKPLILFDADSSRFALEFSAYSKAFTTDSLYFTSENTSVNVSGNDSSSISLRLYTTNKNKYLEYLYTLKGNSYILGYRINMVGFNDIIASNSNDLTLRWMMQTPSQEKSMENQRIATSVYYKYQDDDATSLSLTSDEKKTLESKAKWVALKQQFFTSVLIADNGFEKPTDVETRTLKNSSRYVKELSVALTIPYLHQANESFPMKFYFGPNHYKTLSEFNIQLEKQVPLGWGIFGWVNRFLVIPIFNFLNGFNMNYGIVILILTIIIKIILLPIAYKANLSAAKMRVLKPEIDELNKRYEGKEAMEKQQATMALYKKAGINPMAGCIPALLQMPILFALINFFPTSIELRQQGFLWAEDLSTFDSIATLPFHIPGYGSHVSLFALLMTVSTYLYMWSNNQLMGGGGNDAMQKQMKVIMYIMPVFFLGFLNSRSAGLSYYYFLANMITFGQTFVFKRFIDEDKIHQQIQENKKKPAKAAGGWQKRLEDLARERQKLAQQNQKKK